MKDSDAQPTTTDREADIIRQAREHKGRFLLPRRYRGAPLCGDLSETDHQYDACQRLVDRREARWLTGNMAPGIELLK